MPKLRVFVLLRLRHATYTLNAFSVGSMVAHEEVDVIRPVLVPMAKEIVAFEVNVRRGFAKQ